MIDDERSAGSMHPDGSTSPEEATADAGRDADALPGLALHDVGAGAAVRIRRRALDELERQRQLGAYPAVARVALWCRRAVEPVLLIGLGVGYCAWAAAGALAALH